MKHIATVDEQAPQMPVKRLIVLITLLVCLVGLSTGCASVKTTAAPGADFAKLKTCYVRKNADDKRGLEKIIAEQLNKMGRQATSGIDDAPSVEVDAIVTYKDKWMWDITMYMIRLDIQMLDGKTRLILGSAKSYRPSLQRKTPEGMVEEVLTSILKPVSASK